MLVLVKRTLEHHADRNHLIVSVEEGNDEALDLLTSEVSR
jgi:hypothetical protein